MQSRLKGIFRDYINKKLRVGRPDEIRLGKEDFEELYNPYYAKLSFAFGISSIIISALLVLFVLGSVIFNIGSVTYENLYYFIKDFDSVVSSDEFIPSSVIYNYEENRTFAGYKGGFVSAGRSSLTVYSATGRKTKTFYNGYSNPVIKTSAKYILVYDIGGSELSVYNSFARLLTESFDHSILGADICDDGSFIVLTTDKSKSAIYRYNSSFKLVAIYPYPNYITSAAISPDGNNLMVSYADAQSGELVSVSEIFTGLTEEPAHTIKRPTGITLMSGIGDTAPFSGNVRYFSVTSGGVFAGSGTTGDRMSVAFDKGDIIDIASDGGGVVVAVADREGYVMHVLPYEGNSQSIRLDSAPRAVQKNGSLVYVLSAGSLSRYNIAAGTFGTISLSAGAEDIILSGGGYVFVCYPSRALSIKY